MFYIELVKSIEKFTVAETSKYYDEQNSKGINAFKNMKDADVDQLVEKWASAFTEVSISRLFC